MKSYVWFDLDDTLTDFAGSSHVALTEIYAKHGLERYFEGVEQWLDIYHRHNAALWERFNRGEVTGGFLRTERYRLTLAERCGDVFPAELPLALSRDYLHVLAESAHPLPGAREALEWLRSEGVGTGVLTNGFDGVQQRKLAVARLDGLVDHVVVSDRVGINKPRRGIFDHASALCGADASHCVMIGDNPDTDVAGAVGAGWHSVLFDPAGRRSDHPGPRAASLVEAARMALDMATKR